MVEKKIQKLCDEVMEQHIFFPEFASSLLALGVDRGTFDLIKFEHSFYDDTRYLGSHVLPEKYHFSVAEIFDEKAVKAAIAAFDQRELSSHQFHVALGKAGVLVAIGFFNDHRAMYLGRKGQFYLEEWADGTY